MRVGKLCARDPVSVRRTDDLTRAAKVMREKHIGYLIVTDLEADGSMRPVGVLTDRDIVVSVVARETDPRSLRVEDVMTECVVTIGESEPLERALSEMQRCGVRRLPVVGQQGQLVGILSIDDVLAVLASNLQSVAGSIRNERLIEGTVRQ